MSLPGMAPLVLACLALSACHAFNSREALVSERAQTLAIESEPASAQCTVLQGGRTVGTVTTPGQVTLTTTADDVYIICEKGGYEPAATWLRSDYDRTDPLLGSPVGWVIDPIIGSYYAYDDGAKIRLIEERDPNTVYQN